MRRKGLYVMLPDFPTLLIGWAWYKDERMFEFHLGLFVIGYDFKWEENPRYRQ